MTDNPYAPPSTPPVEINPYEVDPLLVKDLMNSGSMLAVINRLRLKGFPEKEASLRVNASLELAKRKLKTRNFPYYLIAAIGLGLSLCFFVFTVFDIGFMSYTSIFKGTLGIFPLVVAMCAFFKIKKIRC